MNTKEAIIFNSFLIKNYKYNLFIKKYIEKKIKQSLL